MLELPWPPSKLSPNGSHGNYHARRHVANKYRGDCVTVLEDQPVPKMFTDGPIILGLTFCPPTRVLADLDNLLSRTKQGIDALAEVMGVNDKLFEFNLRRGDPVKGGKIVVTLEAAR